MQVERSAFNVIALINKVAGSGTLAASEYIGAWFSPQVLSCKHSELSCMKSNKGVSSYNILLNFAVLFLVIFRHPGQQETLYTQPTSEQFLSQITRVCRIQLFWEQSEVTANQQSLKSNLSRHPLLMACHIYLNISIHKWMTSPAALSNGLV